MVCASNRAPVTLIYSRVSLLHLLLAFLFVASVIRHCRSLMLVRTVLSHAPRSHLRSSLAVGCLWRGQHRQLSRSEDILSAIHSPIVNRKLSFSRVFPSVRIWANSHRSLSGESRAERGGVEPEWDGKVKHLLAMELPTNESCPELVKIRHSAAHVLAMAVQRKFPKAMVATGPWTEHG